MGKYLEYRIVEGSVYECEEGMDSLFVSVAWAGNHEGKNNPDMCDKPCVGPLPIGWYDAQPWEAQHGHLGPMVCFLKPDPSNEMYGRGDFFCHGPDRGPNFGQESKGCIVAEHEGRQKIHDTGISRWRVVA
jgi:hypothetical protein